MIVNSDVSWINNCCDGKSILVRRSVEMKERLPGKGWYRRGASDKKGLGKSLLVSTVIGHLSKSSPPSSNPFTHTAPKKPLVHTDTPPQTTSDFSLGHQHNHVTPHYHQFTIVHRTRPTPIHISPFVLFQSTEKVSHLLSLLLAHGCSNFSLFFSPRRIGKLAILFFRALYFRIILIWDLR